MANTTAQPQNLMSQPVIVQSGHSLTPVYVSEKDYIEPATMFSTLWRYVRQAADACMAPVRSMPVKARAQTKSQHCAGIARASYRSLRSWTRKRSYNEGNALQTIATQPLRRASQKLLQECGRRGQHSLTWPMRVAHIPQKRELQAPWCLLGLWARGPSSCATMAWGRGNWRR